MSMILSTKTKENIYSHFFFGLIPNHALYWVNSSFPWKKLLNTWSYRTSAIIKMRLDKGFVYRD